MKAFLAVIAEVLCLPLLIFSRPKHREPKRILVIEPWGIGDLVLSTGVLTDLSCHWPNAEISVLSRSYGEIILRYHDRSAKSVRAELPWTMTLRGKYKLWRWPWRYLIALLKELRSTKYDIVMECRGDIRNHIIMAAIGAGTRVGFSSGAGLLLTDKADCKPLLSHRIEDWKKVCAVLGINQQSLPGLTVSEATRRKLAKKFNVAAGGWLGVHLGAKNSAKRWPMADFEKFLTELDRTENPGPIVLFCEADDDLSEMDIPDDVVLATEISLEELIVAIANCRKFVCCDGGAMHIAAALGVSVVALFGPTSADWFGPVGGGHTLLQKDVCPYRPCFDLCRFPRPICMEAISVNDLLKSME